MFINQLIEERMDYGNLNLDYRPEASKVGVVDRHQQVSEAAPRQAAQRMCKRCQRHREAADEPSGILKLVDEQATREEILKAFRTHLVENQNIRQGDIVVVYYSGHGSYVKDMNGDEESGYDQTLVPYDAGRARPEDVRDVTDDELALLLDNLSLRTQNINLFFDSCHSGTVTRDLQDALEPNAEGLARWIEPWEDDVPLQVGLPVGEGVRGMGPSEWLPLSEGYILIAGCQADERSREYSFSTGILPLPRKWHGALTYYLLQALGEVGPDTTYYDIWDNVRTKVTSKNSTQHPQIEGAFERKVFGGAAAPRQRYITVTEKTGDEVTLAAGLVNGATAGSRFAIYTQGTQTFDDPASSVAIVKLVQMDAFMSVGKIETGDVTRVTVGASAVEIEHDYGSMQMAVRVLGDDPVLNAVHQRIVGSRLLRLVTTDEEPATATVRLGYPLLPDGQKDASTGQKLHILGGGGFPLVEPVVPDGDGPTTLCDKLEHIAKYSNILAIRNMDPRSQLKDKVQLRLLKVVGQDANGQDQLEPVERSTGGDIRLTVGDRVVLAVENLSNQPLHVTILDCDTEFQVQPIFPPATASDDAVGANQSRMTNRFKVSLPEHQMPVQAGFCLPQETVKVIATTERINFRSLWLPALRGGDLDGKDLGEVAGGGSSLYHLMDLAVGGSEERATRALTEDRQDPERGGAGRSPRRAAEEIRASHQPQDRPGAGPDHPADAPLPGGRRDPLSHNMWCR
jgi:hypothetical protein